MPQGNISRPAAWCCCQCVKCPEPSTLLHFHPAWKPEPWRQFSSLRKKRLSSLLPPHPSRQFHCFSFGMILSRNHCLSPRFHFSTRCFSEPPLFQTRYCWQKFLFLPFPSAAPDCCRFLSYCLQRPNCLPSLLLWKHCWRWNSSPCDCFLPQLFSLRALLLMLRLPAVRLHAHRRPYPRQKLSSESLRRMLPA